MVDIDRVSDLELLRQVARVQDQEIRRLHQKLAELTAQLTALKGGDASALRAQLQLLQKDLDDAYRRTYSKGSERRPSRREEPPAAPRSAPKSGHGPKAQPRLPIVDAVHLHDEADMTCPSCGGGLEAWPGQFEESEEVDVVEVQYVLKKHRRQKYRCACGGCVETAPGPVKLVPGGRYSLDFAIDVALSKWCDHLPLDRQVRRMHRYGLEVTSQTLWDQTYALAGCFKQAMLDLHRHLLSKDVLLADESHWPLLGAKGRPTENWFTWALLSDDAVLYRILDSRSNDAAEVVLENFSGTLLTDGYVVYRSRSKTLGFKQAHDWSHARRYFIEAEASSPEASTAFLDDIGKLFQIERDIGRDTAGLDPEATLVLKRQRRRELATTIVGDIGRRAAEVRAPRDSPIAKAVKYLENQWNGLTCYLGNPSVPITSNGVERALRCSVLGRKNHLGSRSKRGIETAEIFYSLIETAKMNSLDPREYLRNGALAHLRGEPVLLPHQVAQR